MKAKKASKRLQKVEGLLAGILDGYSKADNVVHGLVDTAKTAVAGAMTMLQAKPAARATKPSSGRPAPQGRRQPSRVARKPVAGAKQNALQAANGRSVRKSA